MADTHVAILAAGRGTRMKSSLPKVLHRVAGLPMIDHVLRAVRPLQTASTSVVLGYMADQVRLALSCYPGLRFVIQGPQLGTGHALLQTESLLADATGTLLLLAGDVPRLTTATLDQLVKTHEAAGVAATVLTAVVSPTVRLRPRGAPRRAGRTHRRGAGCHA